MLRNVFALLVSGALVFGASSPVSARSDDSKQSPPGSVQVMTGPLAPGGAAGIKQAQAQRGRVWNFVPFGVVGGLAALVVLMNDDDGEIATTTTGSN